MTPIRLEAVYERRPLAAHHGAPAAVRWGVRAAWERDRSSRSIPDDPLPGVPVDRQGRPSRRVRESGQPALRYTAQAVLVPLDPAVSGPAGGAHLNRLA